MSKKREKIDKKQHFSAHDSVQLLLIPIEITCKYCFLFSRG